MSRAVDVGRIRNRRWFLPILLLAPLIYLLSYLVMRLARLPLPEQIDVPLQTAPGFFLLYFMTGLGEELGWTAYATDSAQKRWGALKGGLLLGIVWALWHAVAFVQTGSAIGWVAWQSVKTIAMRVIIVWIYNNSGKSVFAAALYHVIDNVSWSLFPNFGTHYSPMVTGLLNVLVAALIALGWEGKTLREFRLSKRGDTKAVTS